jgi:ribosomal protein L11 methyltransferase
VWLELSVSADIAAVEAISAIFQEHGEGGVAIDQPVFSDLEGEHYGLDTSRPAIVRTYLPLDDETAARRERIERALWHVRAFNLAPIGPLEEKQLAERDWQDAWREHYHPLRIGARMVVKPTWRDYAARPDDVVVELDPGMAFGTGSHQTTALCLVLLEETVKPGSLVLDQGTGSGILAIAAAKLGARAVDAVDISAVAVRTARENVAHNGLAGRVLVEQVRDDEPPGGAARGETRYDLIVANIIARLIVAMAPGLAVALAGDGVLIASGIIREREDEVAGALQAAGLTVLDRRRQDEWVALLATRAVEH